MGNALMEDLGSSLGGLMGGLLVGLTALWGIEKISESLEGSKSDKKLWSDLP